MATDKKPLHTVILDSGPIIRGDPSISSLLAQAEQIITLPSVINEIRDETTRSRLQTTLLPFLTLKTPKDDSIKVISDFARRTGDLAVLSRVDIQLLALTYDLECERNGGPWRLRKSPGEKRIQGAAPSANVMNSAADQPSVDVPDVSTSGEVSADTPAMNEASSPVAPVQTEVPSAPSEVDSGQAATIVQTEELETSASSLPPHDAIVDVAKLVAGADDLQISTTSSDASSGESDSEGWITPSNLKKKQAEDAGEATNAAPEPSTLQVALITSDFAMQNVALQMNLNLISASLHRVKHIKTFVLRCHACFNVIRDTSKQFCPRCGQSTLTRVSCSTSQNGEFKLHLKKNMQWNKRGAKYSVPKPVHGASHGRVTGGGKGGWGNDLILAEDQKEYTRAMEVEKRQKQRDLMDEDYLPGILSGNRINSGGKIKVGAGRNVNSRKRK